MAEYPYHLMAGDTFTLTSGDARFSAIATSPTTIRDETDAKAFVSGYSFPHTIVPGETIYLLGREVVVAIEKTFESYDDMEWWCATAEGIPELGLFDAVRSENEKSGDEGGRPVRRSRRRPKV